MYDIADPGPLQLRKTPLTLNFTSHLTKCVFDFSFLVLLSTWVFFSWWNMEKFRVTITTLKPLNS